MTHTSRFYFMLEELLRVLKEDDTNLEVKIDGNLPQRLIFTNRGRRYVVYRMHSKMGSEHYYMIDGDGDYIEIINGSPIHTAICETHTELPFVEACNQAINELLEQQIDLTTCVGARQFREILRPLFVHVS